MINKLSFGSVVFTRRKGDNSQEMKYYNALEKELKKYDFKIDIIEEDYFGHDSNNNTIEEETIQIIAPPTLPIDKCKKADVFIHKQIIDSGICPTARIIDDYKETSTKSSQPEEKPETNNSSNSPAEEYEKFFGL